MQKATTEKAPVQSVPLRYHRSVAANSGNANKGKKGLAGPPSNT